MTILDKVAIVTGGAQGIGKAITEAFLEKGVRVMIVDKDKQAGIETRNEFDSIGHIEFIHADVSNEKAVQNIISKTRKQFKRIDYIINNAGYLIHKPIKSLSFKEWNDALGANLSATFLLSKYGLPELKKNKGCIVNIASTRALMSESDTESYSASKGGLVALTHSLAISLGPDVRVNCISPGWIDVSDWKRTGLRRKAVLSKADKLQHPVGRVGKPEDIASMVIYLVSPESSFITGANFVIDGGMTHKMIYV